MTSVAELLHGLALAGVRLKAEGDQLRVSAPKGALTAELRERLVRHKLELLSLLGRGGEAAVDGAEIVPRPRPDERYEPFPLTEMQQAYWLGRSAAFRGGSVACQIYFEADSEGLDVARLEAALRQLVERHDMLRAIVRPDGLLQVLRDVPAYAIAVDDLRGLAPGEAEARLAARRDATSHRVAPTDAWPLFEVRASRCDGGHWRLHARFEIIAADGQSISTILREWDALYREPGAPLAPLELTFRDYACAAAEARQGEAYERSRRYWLSRLDELPGPPELPSAPANAAGPPRFARHAVELDADAWTSLRERARRHGLTPSAVLCTAYAEVLGAWGRSRRFALNLTVLDRPPVHPDVQALVGDFTRTVLLAADLSEPTFVARASAMQARLLADLEHARFSGVEVLRELARRADGSGASAPFVFTSSLGARNALPTRSALGELVFAVSQTPQVWLDHQVAERGDRLALTWDAVEAAFPAGLVAEMFDAYAQRVRRLALDDTAWESTARGLVPDGQLEARRRANATEGPVLAELLHEPFLAQARAHPDRPAVIAPGRTLTYGELLAHSGRIASRLARARLAPGARVAVIMEKGWEQVAAVLGVLRAGAVYVPVDPELPAERISAVLADSGAPLALTQPWLLGRVEFPATVETLPVDDATFAGEAPEPAPAPRAPDAPAYIIFTSGSTGRPKGVVIDHRGALNTVIDVNERLGVGPDDRVLALSSLSFDLSVYDVFGLLAAGGAIVMPAAHAQRDPAHWLERLEAHGVTLWNTVPALFEMLAEYATGRGVRLPAALRWAMLSGDWIPLDLPRQAFALSDRLQLLSMGGATEASIWSIAYPVTTVDPSWASIPYGRPLRNQHFHVLDDDFEPCPTWVPGQLYIAGVGLAHGYWGDADKTRASFVRHPQTGERLYRTGDLGRYLPDGVIEFLGREDTQVKVHGHRIELGEIESALVQHGGVRAAVAAAVGERGARRLVAYVVPAVEDPSLERRLVELLQAKLPRYMVPSAFVLLPALPLGPNGKVDRRALPAPQRYRPVLEVEYTAPRNALERAIAEAWQAALGVERVGIHDNFFDLGGNSVQMVSLYRRLTGLAGAEHLAVVDLFTYPTVGSLGDFLARAPQGPQPSAPTAAPARDRAALRDRAAQQRQRRQASRTTSNEDPQ
ncbi:MAG: amino acid adenylation domain-containing protein [Polyangiaceae bacterium]|nr:amino acid adenylation domain-containing protein [Polyangiaceae bacterium]